jgi:hypothetical protein
LLTVFAAVSNCYCAPAFEKPVQAEVSHCSHHTGPQENSEQDCGPRYHIDQFENAAPLSLREIFIQPILFLHEPQLLDALPVPRFFSQKETAFLAADSPPEFFLLHHAFLI